MSYDLTNREYLEITIRRCEEKLSTMTDPVRIAVATSHLNDLRRWKRTGIPKGVEDCSVTVKVRIREM